MNYIITTQLTQDYWDKFKLLEASIKKHWPYKFIPGFIDFDPQYEGEHYLMNSKYIFTYSKDYPKNRKKFICPQGGEFIDYLNCERDDTIIYVDADTVMQRPITDQELQRLACSDYDLKAVYGANPVPSLRQVADNLKFKHSAYLDNYFLTLNKEFAASFLVANGFTFLMLKNYVIGGWPFILDSCEHHAGIQWLISDVSHINLNVDILPSTYQCGAWYIKFDTSTKDNVLYLGDEVVIFNHTK